MVISEMSSLMKLPGIDDRPKKDDCDSDVAHQLLVATRTKQRTCTLLA
jgi:hypothetical protein